VEYQRPQVTLIENKFFAFFPRTKMNKKPESIQFPNKIQKTISYDETPN
jgi:hypothetical protein